MSLVLAQMFKYLKQLGKDLFVYFLLSSFLFLYAWACVCVSRDYTADESEQKSGIKEPLKFHLPFGYKIYVGKCGLKREGENLLFVHTNF